jgi:RecA/RadA recombinase
MALNKKALSRLLALDGAVTEASRYDVHASVIATHSPSFNFTFGNGWGLPEGYTLLLYGPPRGGKSIILNLLIGWLHQTDPEAIAVKFNTEFRENAQLTPKQAQELYGIDPDRVITYETNDPEKVFDRIEGPMAAEIQDGLKIKLVGIDSVNGIVGRRGMKTESVTDHTIGDHAQTMQIGLQRILPVQRKYRFALVLCSQIRTQIDPKSGTTGMVYKTQTTAIKPAVSFGTQHHAEYYMYVEPRGGAKGRTDESGVGFIDESVKDAKGEGEQTGHRISVKMVDASFGPKGRSGLFTFDYKRGLINVHEEVFDLGVNRGVIDKPNNVMYAFGGKEWRGKPALLEALREDQALRDSIVAELVRRDRLGTLPETDDEKTD